MKKSIAVFFILLIFSLQTSCSSERRATTDVTPDAPETSVVPEEHEIHEAFETYETCSLYDFSAVMVNLVENGKGFSYRTYMFETVSDGVTYAFEKTIPLEEAMKCIDITKKILEYTANRDDFCVRIFSPDSYSDMYVNENVVYIPLLNKDLKAYTEAVLYAAYGEYCNYGAIYGYADRILGELSNSEINVCSFSGTDVAEAECLDINLLCFNDRFVSPESVKAAENAAKTFVNEYIEKNGQEAFCELIKKSGTREGVREYADQLGAFYLRHGIAYEPDTMMYAPGGSTQDYLAKNAYACFSIRKDWQNCYTDRSPLTYEDFLHTNYHDVKEYFDTVTYEMGMYRQMFGFDVYNNELNIYYDDSSGLVDASYYSPDEHCIILRGLEALSHEYVHSITYDKLPKDAWYIEGVATYYEETFNRYGIAMLNRDYNRPDLTEESAFVAKIRKSLGRDIDFATDSRLVYDCIVIARKMEKLDDNGGYETGASFIGYLLDVYGREETFKMLFSKTGIDKKELEVLEKDWYRTTEEKVYAFWGEQ